MVESTIQPLVGDGFLRRAAEGLTGGGGANGGAGSSFTPVSLSSQRETNLPFLLAHSLLPYPSCLSAAPLSLLNSDSRQFATSVSACLVPGGSGPEKGVLVVVVVGGW